MMGASSVRRNTLKGLNMLQYLGILGGIILVDLTLSGDNALVIGAAASGLPRRQRTLAILTGGGAAIVLRILFTVAAALLLQIPLLQTIGAVLLLFIAVRLLVGQHGGVAEERHEGASGRQVGFWSAMFTILIADVTMSLDNILAVAALARDEIPLLIIGLLLSVLILLVGSALVAELIQRLPWLMDVAALVLGWTAAHMILSDDIVRGYLEQLNLPFLEVVVSVIAIGVVVIADIFLRVRAARSAAMVKG
jgi:YjbE family integral membrane protein